MSTRSTPESGLRIDRIGVLREAVTGETPADPNWQYHSDEYMTFSWAPAPEPERRDQLGSAYASGHDVGNEGHEVTVAYRLQRALVDANGDPEDFSTDGMLRNADGEIPNTHSILAREDRVTPNPDDPADVQGARIYTVVKGAYPDPSMEGDPETGEPIPMELTYVCEKVRSYEVLQPDAASAITVESLDPDDIGLDVVIEDEGAATAETVTLTEETDVDGNFVAANATTTATFGDVDAVAALAEPTGDLDVSIDGGSTLTTIRGAMYYSKDDQPLEGDRGVPALGTGSHGTQYNQDFEHFLGDRVTRGGADLAIDLNDITFEIDNGYDETSREDSTRYRITAGNAEPAYTADVIGRSHRHIEEALTATSADIVHELSRTDITLADAAPTESPERDRESDDAAASLSVSFEPEGDGSVQLTNTEA